MSNKDARRLPVVSHGAEFLAIGYLMRRNILAYKAPPNNEGYDLICIHPDPRQATNQLRIQVKSRYQTDCDRAFPVKEKTFDAFDYLLVVFQNIGFFSKNKRPVLEGYRQPEIYCFPNTWIRQHHKIFESGWQKVHTKGLEAEIEEYKNEPCLSGCVPSSQSAHAFPLCLQGGWHQVFRVLARNRIGME